MRSGRRGAPSAGCRADRKGAWAGDRPAAAAIGVGQERAGPRPSPARRRSRTRYLSRARSSGHGPARTGFHSSRSVLDGTQFFAARRSFSCRRQMRSWMSRTAAVGAPGSLVLNRYLPVRPLGTGGSGSVWLAREAETGREVALKIVPREGTAGSRAEREAAAAARLRHPRCLRAHALARDGGHVYIVYEYVSGRTLREAMRAGDIGDAAALEAAAQVREGLAHAHAHGIVHRDVKPANVLLADGGGISVKLFDFGLALIHEEEGLTAAGDIPGTLAYISPERLRG